MANRNRNKTAGDYYPGYRHPKVLIGYVVWSYHRFTLSLRDVSEQLLMRGIIVSHETIREWSLEFGQSYANEIKRRAPRRGDKMTANDQRAHLIASWSQWHEIVMQERCA